MNRNHTSVTILCLVVVCNISAHAQDLFVAQINTQLPNLTSIIERVDVATGETSSFLTLADTLIVDMAIDQDGFIYVVDFRDLQRDRTRLRRFNASGVELDPLVSSLSGADIISVEVDPQGVIHFGTAGEGQIGVGRFGRDGAELDALPLDRSLIGIGFGKDSEVLVGITENSGSSVERVSAGGGTDRVILDQLQRPSEIAFDRSNRLLVLDDSTSTIHVAGDDGEYLGILGGRPFGFQVKDFVVTANDEILLGGDTRIERRDGVFGSSSDLVTVDHTIAALAIAVPEPTHGAAGLVAAIGVAFGSFHRRRAPSTS